MIQHDPVEDAQPQSGRLHVTAKVEFLFIKLPRMVLSDGLHGQISVKASLGDFFYCVFTTPFSLKGLQKVIT